METLLVLDTVRDELESSVNTETYGEQAANRIHNDNQSEDKANKNAKVGVSSRKIQHRASFEEMAFSKAAEEKDGKNAIQSWATES